jgi:hypothetical protein
MVRPTSLNDFSLILYLQVPSAMAAELRRFGEVAVVDTFEVLYIKGIQAWNVECRFKFDLEGPAKLRLTLHSVWQWQVELRCFTPKYKDYAKSFKALKVV